MVTAGFRDDNPEHLQALREALVNLIIYTDYFSGANPRIRVFSNRFEFFNPGSLSKKIEYILEEDFSLPRNPIITKIFRFVRMIDGWEQHYGLEPGIEGDFDYYKITFPITTTQKIIALIGESPEINRKELAEVIGLTEDGIKYHLKKMQEKGILKRIGPAKGGYWEVIEK